MNTPVCFESTSGGPLPHRVGRQHAICLYYFVQQALSYACASGSQVSAQLKDDHNGMYAIVGFVSADSPEGLGREGILPLLQEWLRVWGGRVDYSALPDRTVTLAAWMGANTSG